MLGRASTRKIFLLKICNRACIKELLLLNILGKVATKKVVFAENDGQGMYIGISFNLKMLGGAHTKKFFPLKILDGAGIKNLL